MLTYKAPLLFFIATISHSDDFNVLQKNSHVYELSRLAQLVYNLLEPLEMISIQAFDLSISKHLYLQISCMISSTNELKCIV